MPGKIKILNDPVSGFVRVSDPLFFEIIDHPYFQRLRQIKQLGLTYLVYPGAMHTRFQHALGAFQMMNELIEILRVKGVDISHEEQNALLLAILLHDIGHGPFSHALESAIVEVGHEDISQHFLHKLNELFGGVLNQAIKVFTGTCQRPFMHQLISGQLDIDRLDYLRRDSFFTGVSEGNIGSDRIIRIMDVADEHLVIEKKGIYSIEHFLVARRMMYWQVYLHKTVISAEQMLLKIFERAKDLALNNFQIDATPALRFFLYNNVSSDEFKNPEILDTFAMLDDSDVILALKVWSNNQDRVLSFLSKCLLNRKLFRIEISNHSFSAEYICEIKRKIQAEFGFSEQECENLVMTDSVRNTLYDTEGVKINVKLSDGKMVDISDPACNFNVSIMIDPVEKFFLCYPRIIN